MAERWRIALDRLPRWGLPTVGVKLNGVFVTDFVVSSGEVYTSLAREMGKTVRYGEPFGPGRRTIPSDTGTAIVPIVRLSRLELLTVDRRWLDLGPLTVPAAFRGDAIGAGGLLGLDVLARFSRIVFEVGPPDVLVLERET